MSPLHLRHFIYDDTESSFHPLCTLKSSHKCVVCVQHFFHRTTAATTDGGSVTSGEGHHPILCSASTDGRVSLWDVLPLCPGWRCDHTSSSCSSAEEGVDMPPLAVSPVSPVTSFKLHQSGINDLAVQSSCDGSEVSRHVLVSVGDDNALAVVHFTARTRGGCVEVELVRQGVQLTAHTSAITGTVLIPPYIF